MKRMVIPVLPEDGWLEQHRGSPLPAMPLVQGCSLFSKYLGKKPQTNPQKVDLLAIEKWDESWCCGPAKQGTAER